MYLLVDNYDSFVYNLAAYIRELGREIKIVRNDKMSFEQLERIISEEGIQGIIISPGPKTPKESGVSKDIISYLYKKIPILGVCLGHQTIAYQFGASIGKGRRPMHGKVNDVYHNGEGIFRKIPSPYKVTRYHSLEVKESELPDCLKVNAKTEDGVVMAISHREFPVFGVQFHPEAVLTQYGHKLLENFLMLCEERGGYNEDRS